MVERFSNLLVKSRSKNTVISSRSMLNRRKEVKCSKKPKGKMSCTAVERGFTHWVTGWP